MAQSPSVRLSVKTESSPYELRVNPDQLHSHQASILPVNKQGSGACQGLLPDTDQGQGAGGRATGGGEADQSQVCPHPGKTANAARPPPPLRGSAVWWEANPLWIWKDPDRNLFGVGWHVLPNPFLA